MNTTTFPNTQNTDWLDVVRSKVDNLTYGVVQIVVHDGKVTQIECTEKVRFESSKKAR